MHIDTQVIVVTTQPTPNLTPALDPELKPGLVVMLVSPDMDQHAGWLVEVLQPRGIRVERRDIPDPCDVDDLRDRLLDLAAEHEHETIALNLTGGNKLTTIAAYEVFHDLGQPIFYVHPERDRLIWLQPKGLPSLDLADRLRLEPFLRAHGASLAERPAGFGMADNLKTLAEALVLDVDRYAQALSTLNWAAMKAEAADSLVSPELGTPLGRGDFLDLLGGFEAEGLVSVDQRRLIFTDETARFFANGGWLEQYVYSLVQELKGEHPIIQDLGRGLEVTRAAGPGESRNELDVAFLANNRLYVIECKTRKFNDEAQTGGAGADALYKLDTLSTLFGGIHARSMLVSYQPLSQSVLDRARDYGILTSACGELRFLKETLKRLLA